ncbi:TVP38/TMEM64 family protein [Mesonia ostreae]|uniref:TVP38/TMEM64 family membrane protein n=1 Tax=Mesonia ostreae TaxID=861110 RepID=A0ABU2KJW5_9FLAO|nr:VTT domain-containing protein [Mesonia ostreae]MDT0295022.1 VTT domain-containing protein [Mesonia ostreae]
MEKQKLIKNSSLIITAAIFAVLILLYFFYPNFQQGFNEFWEVLMTGNEEKIANEIKSYGAYGIAIIILFIILQMFLIIFPSWLPMIVAALVYGIWPSILISSTGVFLASTLGYFIGIQLNENALQKFISEKIYKKLEYWVSNYGFWSVVLFRISPFLSNDAISIIAGGLQMKYVKFISATMLGIIPLATAIAFFAQDINTLKTGMYWIGGAGVLFYVAFVIIDHKKRKKQNSSQ